MKTTIVTVVIDIGKVLFPSCGGGYHLCFEAVVVVC